MYTAKRKRLPKVLENERLEFNNKIRTKLNNGFVPDIQKMEANHYFVKQFWREPYLTKLFLGQLLSKYNEYLLTFTKPGAKILDVGCGAGYLSLELARLGYNVTAIDIADEAIAAAEKALVEADKDEYFGSLEYRAIPFSVSQFDVDESFDAVIFSASLHHFPNIEETVEAAIQLCNPGGVVIAYEPARETWTEKDAAILTFIRCALSITGNWYTNELSESASFVKKFKAAVLATLAECSENKDEFTPNGQSENDDIYAGPRIYKALSEQAELLICEPAFSYLHNGFGGIRAKNKSILYNLADLFVVFERYAIEEKVLRPSSEYYVARVRDTKIVPD